MQKRMTTYKITYVWNTLDRHIATIQRPYSEHNPEIIAAYKAIADHINKYNLLCPFDFAVDFHTNVVYHKTTLQIYAKVEVVEEELILLETLKINEKANP